MGARCRFTVIFTLIYRHFYKLFSGIYRDSVVYIHTVDVSGTQAMLCGYKQDYKMYNISTTKSPSEN